MKIYLAGPMRGLPEWNFPAFDAAEKRWRDAGHTPFNPAATTRAIYGRSDPWEAGADVAHLRHVIDVDLACVKAADAIALLPGWESSAGATVELSLAQFLGMEVYNALTLEPASPLRTPWDKVR